MYFISNIRKTMCLFQPLKKCLLLVRLELGAGSCGLSLKMSESQRSMETMKVQPDIQTTESGRSFLNWTVKWTQTGRQRRRAQKEKPGQQCDHFGL